ncbi:MAG: DUF2971 domain-containing protein [Desulfobacterales bacterium]|nr:MAG: DUF2971 domain-containing protein [Desulfobacterales bacterium]
MTNEILFKYRSLDNWKFLLDIFLEQRLYASSFRSLNDPMEGRYYYFGDEVTKAFKRAIRESKDYWKICSLTRKSQNTLMWSYYGGGHTGVALGVAICQRRGQRILSVSYDNEVYVDESHLRRSPKNVALEILSQKQLNWMHEEEVRVFSSQPFVRIELKTVLLGCQMPDADRKLIAKLVKKVTPKAKVRQLSRSDLDSPLNQFAT